MQMQSSENKIKGRQDAEEKCGGCFGFWIFPTTVLALPQKKSLMHLSPPSSFQSSFLAAESNLTFGAETREQMEAPLQWEASLLSPPGPLPGPVP